MAVCILSQSPLCILYLINIISKAQTCIFTDGVNTLDLSPIQGLWLYSTDDSFAVYSYTICANDLECSGNDIMLKQVPIGTDNCVGLAVFNETSPQQPSYDNTSETWTFGEWIGITHHDWPCYRRTEILYVCNDGVDDAEMSAIEWLDCNYRITIQSQYACLSTTISPTSLPILSPISSPASIPTLSPSSLPTSLPISSPTPSPISSPISSPTSLPISSPTSLPISSPTSLPIVSPISSPASLPTWSPISSPTSSPGMLPPSLPTSLPILSPTPSPISSPTSLPTTLPTSSPITPTAIPLEQNVTTYDDCNYFYINTGRRGQSYFTPIDQCWMIPQDNQTISNIVKCVSNTEAIRFVYGTKDCSGDVILEHSLDNLPDEYAHFYVEYKCGQSYNCPAVKQIVYKLNDVDQCIDDNINQITMNDLIEKDDFNDDYELNVFVTGSCTRQESFSFITDCDSNGRLIKKWYLDSPNCSGDESSIDIVNSIGGVINCFDFDAKSFYYQCNIWTESPTMIPTMRPTMRPTMKPTKYPTNAPLPTLSTFVGASFEWIDEEDQSSLITDPFGKFIITIRIDISDESNLMSLTRDCHSNCFKWNMKDITNNGDWILLNIESNDALNLIIRQIDKQFTVKLEFKKVRTKHGGFCVNDNTESSHLLQPNNEYQFKLLIKKGKYSFESQISQNYKTNQIPPNGECRINNVDSITNLDEFNFECNNNDNNANSLTYNVIFEDALISPQFKSSPNEITHIAGTGFNQYIMIISDIYNSYSCQIINVTFPDITDKIQNNQISKEEVLESINDLIPDVNDDGGSAITIVEILNDMKENNITSLEETETIVTNIVNVVSDTSNIENSTSIEIVSKVSTLTAITKRKDIISNDTATNLVDTFLTNIADSVNNNDNNFDQNEKEQIADSGFGLISNILVTFAVEDESDNNKIIEDAAEKAEEIVDLITQFTSSVVTEVGDKYEFIKDNLEIRSIAMGDGLFDIDIDGNKMILPNSFNELDQNVIMTVTKTKQDGLYPVETTSIMDAVFSVIVNNNDNLNERRRIRRLSTLNTETTACDPYFFTFPITNSSILTNNFDNLTTNTNFSANLPVCKYWNNSLNSWQENGCFIYNFTDKTVTCACTHLTTFSVSTNDFIPSANLETLWKWRGFTIKNLIKYPTVWSTILIILIIFGCIYFVINDGDNSPNIPLLAYEDSIFFAFLLDKYESDFLGLQIKYLDSPNSIFYDKVSISKLCSYCSSFKSIKRLLSLQFNLFKLFLQNDHTLISVFQKSNGTNYSSRQRISCFFMYFMTVIAASAIFYGVKQNTKFGDISASAIMSLIATLPVMICKRLFIKSKPIIIKTQNQRFSDIINHFDNDQQEQEQSLATRRSTVMSDALYTVKKQKKVSINILEIALNELKQDNDDKDETDDDEDEKDDIQNNPIDDQIILIHRIRNILLNKTYPYPNYFKKISWFILIFWSIIVCIIAILYGLQFDLKYDTKDLDFDGSFDQCLLNNDIITKLSSSFINYNINKQQTLFNSQLNKNGDETDDYFNNENISDSTTWLLSLFQSLLMSLIIWQPINIYTMTWFKLIAFTNNLKLQSNVAQITWSIITNVFLCCFGCCIQTRKIIPTSNTLQSQNENENKNENISSSRKSVFSQSNRPLDLIGFYGNIALFLPDDDIDKYRNEWKKLKLKIKRLRRERRESQRNESIDNNQSTAQKKEYYIDLNDEGTDILDPSKHVPDYIDYWEIYEAVSDVLQKKVDEENKKKDYY